MKNTKLRIRKSLRMFYVLFFVAIIVVCLCLMCAKIAERSQIIKQEILKYSNKLDTTYTVNIKENSYILEKTLPMEKVYVTDLIDSIDMNLDYLYTATEDANIKYQYRIVGVLSSYYTADGIDQRVWEKEYELKPIAEATAQGKEVKINESIKIDLPSYNKEVANFEKEFGMALKSNLLIKMEVSMVSEVGDIKVDNNYLSNIQIGLGQKTTQIKGDLQDIKSDKVTIKQEPERMKKEDKTAIAIYAILILVSVLCLVYIVSKTRSKNILRNGYKAELNRILKSCDEKIVKLSRSFDLEGKELIEVKDFGELIKLSEELFKPVLYWETPEKETAEFFVIIHNMIYRFKLEEK